MITHNLRAGLVLRNIPLFLVTSKLKKKKKKENNKINSFSLLKSFNLNNNTHIYSINLQLLEN